jgi:hypothetical protein
LIVYRIIDDEGTDTVLDTTTDPWVYLAPRPESKKDQRYRRGSDLFIKERAGKPDIYYMYRWTLVPDEQESIHVVNMKTAERFLEEHSLVLKNYPDLKASATLRSYGYGILEEF